MPDAAGRARKKGMTNARLTTKKFEDLENLKVRADRKFYGLQCAFIELDKQYRAIRSESPNDPRLAVLEKRSKDIDRLGQKLDALSNAVAAELGRRRTAWREEAERKRLGKDCLTLQQLIDLLEDLIEYGVSTDSPVQT